MSTKQQWQSDASCCVDSRSLLLFTNKHVNKAAGSKVFDWSENLRALVGANLLVKDSCRKSGAIQQRCLTNLAPGSRLMHDCCAVDYRLETYPQFLLLLMVGGLQYPVRASVQSLIHTELKPWPQLFWATLYPVQFLLIRVTTLQTVWNVLTFPWRFVALLHGGAALDMLSVTHIMPLNTCMDANMHFTINSFRQLFPDKTFSLTFSWFLVKSLTFPWQLSNSLTFLGFPDKWWPWWIDISCCVKWTSFVLCRVETKNIVSTPQSDISYHLT